MTHCDPVSAITHNTSEYDVHMEWLTEVRLPLYCLVHVELQTARSKAESPVFSALRTGRVLADIYRVVAPQRTRYTYWPNGVG
jgi:hypothetical protein